MSDLLAELVREIEEIDETYWTHRMFALVERAKAINGPVGRHTHVAIQDSEMCGACGRNFRDSVHLRVGESA